MGYQEKIPPLPTRAEELKMLGRLEDSWISQPFFRFYMQESLRRKKMEHGERRNIMWGQYMARFCMYGLLLLPVAMFIPRLFVYSATKVPAHFKPYFFLKWRDASQVRGYQAMKWQAIVWTLLTAAVTEYNMDYRDITDENYEDGKDYKML